MNFKLTKLVLLILFLGFLNTEVSHAQQDPQYTQYLYNTMTVNPAYAGTKDNWHFAGLYRAQWLDVNGAPSTINLGIHNLTHEYSNVGLGLSIIHDQVGPIKETYLDGNFSYILRLGYDGNLSFGLKGGLRMYDTQFSPGDNAEVDGIFQNVNNKILPTVGAGLYYYTQKYYVGLSVPNFLTDIEVDEIKGVIAERLHYFLIAGYVFDLTDSLKFKPSALVKAVKGSPFSYDIAASFLYNDRFSAGVSYRFENSASLMLGFRVNDNLNIGYAYDLSVNDFSKYNNGSHEIFLTYDIFRPKKRIKSPRFF